MAVVVAVLLSACDKFPASAGIRLRADGAVDVIPIYCKQDAALMSVRLVDTHEGSRGGEETLWEASAGTGGSYETAVTLGKTPDGWNEMMPLSTIPSKDYMRVYLTQRRTNGSTYTVGERFRLRDLKIDLIKAESKYLSNEKFQEYAQKESCGGGGGLLG